MKKPSSGGKGGKGGGSGAGNPHQPGKHHQPGPHHHSKQHTPSSAHHHNKHPQHKGHKHPRGLALGEGVACCTAEALAASLRLTGWPVSDKDVLELHWLAGGTDDEGVPITVALEAACEWGLAGVRPASSWPSPVVPGGHGLHATVQSEPHGGPLPLLPLAAQPAPVPTLDLEVLTPCGVTATAHDRTVPTLILGINLPGAHAVCTGRGGGWWSWGELHDPAEWPDAVIEEAWAVHWPAMRE